MMNVQPADWPFQTFTAGVASVEGTPPPAAIVVVVAFLASSALATILTADPHVVVALASFVAGFATGSYYRHLSHRSGGAGE